MRWKERARRWRGQAVSGLIAAALTLAISPETSGAIDAPEWQGAIFVESQLAVGLRWHKVPGADGYRVFRSGRSGIEYVEVATTTTEVYWDKDEAIRRNETYFYVIQAFDASGASARSLEQSVPIPHWRPRGTAAPKWRAVEVDFRQDPGKTRASVKLSWTKNPDAVAYNIYRSERAGKDHLLVGSASQDEFIDVNVEEGRSYFYMLTTLDSGYQESRYSTEQAVTIAKAKAPAGFGDPGAEPTVPRVQSE